MLKNIDCSTPKPQTVRQCTPNPMNIVTFVWQCDNTGSSAQVRNLPQTFSSFESGWSLQMSCSKTISNASLCLDWTRHLPSLKRSRLYFTKRISRFQNQTIPVTLFPFGMSLLKCDTHEKCPWFAWNNYFCGVFYPGGPETTFWNNLLVAKHQRFPL